MTHAAVQQHDLVVIGAGPGGYVAAIRGAQLGLNVGCVEMEPALGGTCLRVGCIPSKALLESSQLYHDAREAFSHHGIGLGDVRLDLARMLRRKDEVVSALTKGVEALLKKNKIARYLGRGRLDGPGRVVAEGPAGTTLLQARHVVIATGSKSGSLPGIAPDGDRIGTSTEALCYPDVPEHLVVIGAGFIGLELGSVWRRLGARVTVLEYLDRILPGADSEIAAEALKVFKKQGIQFRLGAKVVSVCRAESSCQVEVAGSERILCDRVLLAVGRVPNTDGLGLDTVGIQPDARGRIPVDDHLATTAPNVYAIGDVIRGPMLAHKAEDEGIAVAEYIATGTGIVNHAVIPGVVYTLPEFAGVGLTEEQAREQGEIKVGKFPMMANSRAKTNHEPDGFVKVIADAKTDKVLGVWAIASVAGTMIAQAAQAMEFGATSEDIAYTCHAHPTHSEAVKEAAMAVTGKPIHI